MRRLQPLGVARAALVFGALVLLPLVLPEHWILNLAIFTLMYAALAVAWNLIGGYAGYVSLGHAAFFGIGAYALGITLDKLGLSTPGAAPSSFHDLVPFLLLPAIGIGVALVFWWAASSGPSIWRCSPCSPWPCW